MSYPKALQELVSSLTIMPGIGQKTATRIAFDLVQKNRQGARLLANSLIRAVETVQHCQRCRNLSEQTLCPVCLRTDRNPKKLCIVETPADLNMIESSGIYQGYYFVLMGRLSPIDGFGPRELGLDKLQQLVDNSHELEEIILATNSTAEGDSTAFYIREMLKNHKIKITRLAQGIPLGGELEMVDSGTISHAFRGRQEFR